MPLTRLPPRVVIIDGGFGGLAAARSLEKANAEVILIGRSNHHLVQPLLYQVATAALSPADIASAIQAIQNGGRFRLAPPQRFPRLARVVIGALDAADRLSRPWLGLSHLDLGLDHTRPRGLTRRVPTIQCAPRNGP